MGGVGGAVKGRRSWLGSQVDGGRMVARVKRDEDWDE